MFHVKIQLDLYVILHIRLKQSFRENFVGIYSFHLACDVIRIDYS